MFGVNRETLVHEGPTRTAFLPLAILQALRAYFLPAEPGKLDRYPRI